MESILQSIQNALEQSGVLDHLYTILGVVVTIGAIWYKRVKLLYELVSFCARIVRKVRRKNTKLPEALTTQVSTKHPHSCVGCTACATPDPTVVVNIHGPIIVVPPDATLKDSVCPLAGELLPELCGAEHEHTVSAS